MCSLYSSVLYLWVHVSIWAACRPIHCIRANHGIYKKRQSMYLPSSQWSLSLVNVSEKERGEEDNSKESQSCDFYLDMDVKI